MIPVDVRTASGPQKSNPMMPLALGFGAFAVGVGLTFGVIQWQAQQQKIADMVALVEEMRAQQNQPTSEAEAVTRNAPIDLLSLDPELPRSAAAPEVVATPAATPAPAATQQEDVGRSTADRIRALVARSADPMVSAAIAEDVARRETMSIAIQGVNELVAAASVGQYGLSTDEGGRLSISFPEQLEDQRELERLLASAAEAGMIAFASSVQSSDGTFDGRIILFDLVERALLNGTEAERKIGANIRREALALTAQTNSALAERTANTSERFYVVEPGDSLAYISLQFYGNTNAYLRIFQANRDSLSSPEHIQVGQKLLIPAI